MLQIQCRKSSAKNSAGTKQTITPTTLLKSQQDAADVVIVDDENDPPAIGLSALIVCFVPAEFADDLRHCICNINTAAANDNNQKQQPKPAAPG